MPSLMFVMPVYGRIPLARICLRQLRRTCDALTDYGIKASAVVVADGDDLAELDDLRFGYVERDNDFLSRKFNDGLDLAFDPTQDAERPDTGAGRYEVTGRRAYHGHAPGAVFHDLLDPGAEHRALVRGDIRLLERLQPRIAGAYSLPAGWGENPADYAVPIGSDDWVDWRLFTDLPSADTVMGFQRLAFVREDGREMTARLLRYEGGCGIRIYPRELIKPLGYRPADETRKRACDTSILVNVRRANEHMRVVHPINDPRSIVDWKSRADEQLNTYEDLRIHCGQVMGDPFSELIGFFPQVSLLEMRDHYRALVPA